VKAMDYETVFSNTGLNVTSQMPPHSWACSLFMQLCAPMKRKIMQCYSDTQDKSEEQISIWVNIKHKRQ